MEQTKGPWLSYGKRDSFEFKSDVDVHKIYDVAGTVIAKCGKENKALIKAAPDLLKALQNILGKYDIDSNCFQCRWCGREYADIAGADQALICPSDDCVGHIARKVIKPLVNSLSKNC